MAYIKSHSNYVLKKEHQRINDGTIYERDITTIGSVNQFAPGQTPIYKSGNFIITVRNDGKVANQFNKTKWESSNSGNTWTLQNIAEMSSDFEEQNDTKIVLRQDYYDFCDFVYYGSLTEMFRASITDILSRFPGELYGTEEHAYYTSGETVDLENIKERVLLGGENMYYVDNPFGIDIHSVKKPIDGKPIKFFSDKGYWDYEILIGSSNEGKPISSWTVTYENKFCKGNKFATIKIDNLIIEGWVGDNNQVIYLSSTNDFHIRPNEKFIAEFYNNCDSFQKILLDRKTTPKYKSIFSVIKESPRGYYRETETFIFPTTYGDYNIDASSFGFNDFTSRLVEIGEFYDMYFTDNMYRSMTHEAIKNFDWSYTREYLKGDEDDFIQGGQKIQKALRVFAREFDEILSYIDNIKSINRVTYDSRNNLPDYFLIDEVENKGWDAKMVYPYELTEYGYDNKEFTNYTEETQLNNDGFTRHFSQNSKSEISPYSNRHIFDFPNGYFLNCSGVGDIPCYYNCDNNCPGDCDCKNLSIEGLGQVDAGMTQTYSAICTETPNCDCNNLSIKGLGQVDAGTTQTYSISCVEVPDGTYGYKESTGDTTDYDNGQIRNRIKSYSNEKPYTYMDINNEFLRRLSINSSHIFRHKGTIEGVEMALAMFGLKSKRWVEKRTPCHAECGEPTTGCAPQTITGPSSIELDENGNGNATYNVTNGVSQSTKASNTGMSCTDYDYEIIEYSSIAKAFEDKWDPIHQMYRIDWINSTKTIVYDNRSMSNYTAYGVQSDYEAYQGLPVSWRYDESDKMFIKNGTPYLGDGEEIGKYADSGITSEKTEAFVDSFKNPVRRRWLYPNFDKYSQLDGNPYFQMNGGWLSKSIVSNDGKSYFFQYDADDNMAYSECINLNETTDKDNHPIYKETVRNIRRVDSISDLLNTPVGSVKNGTVFYVSTLKDVAVVNNSVYEIKYEYYSGRTISYISLVKNDSYVQIGDDRFFNDMLYVYDRNFTQSGTGYSILDKSEGYEVKAYFDEKIETPFICKADTDGYYQIDDFMVFHSDSNGKVKDEKGNEIDVEYTNYFILDDTYYANRMWSSGSTNGWRRLATIDPEYVRINTITNYYEGNNAHNGNMVYDNGHEYFTYFKRLFKHALDYDLFDDRCYEAFYYDADSEVSKYGFSGLIDDDEMIKDYTGLLIPDSKIHYFGNYYPRDDDNTPVFGKVCSCNIKVTGITKTDVKDVVFYGDDKYCLDKDLNHVKKEDAFKLFYDNTLVSGFTRYNLAKENNESEDKMIFGNPYFEKAIDEVTDQIVNNKRLTIIFYIDSIADSNDWYSKESQCGIKYIDDVVMNYLTQMIPSSTIVDIKYQYREADKND